MKTIWTTILGMAALGIAPALAADLPARTYTKAPPPIAPLPNWAGFYIGVNGGGAWSRNCWDLTGVLGVTIPSIAEGCSNADGGVAGGQIGYRWQSANFVFGLEAQGDWADLKGSNTSSPAALTALATNQTRTDAIGLFTGQVGYAWDNVLWYVKGGAALTHNKYNGFITGTGIAFDSASETRWGGVVGTGVEFGFAPGWSVAVEYDRLFMGSRDRTFTAAPLGLPLTTRNDSIRQDVDMATVRINYRFGGPVVARY